MVEPPTALELPDDSPLQDKAITRAKTSPTATRRAAAKGGEANKQGSVYLKQDEKVYLVHDWATLQRWIMERRVSRDDQVSEGGVDWTPVGSKPELGSFFAAVEQLEALEVGTTESKASPPPEPPSGLARLDDQTEGVPIGLPPLPTEDLEGEESDEDLGDSDLPPSRLTAESATAPEQEQEQPQEPEAQHQQEPEAQHQQEPEAQHQQEPEPASISEDELDQAILPAEGDSPSEPGAELDPMLTHEEPLLDIEEPAPDQDLLQEDSQPMIGPSLVPAPDRQIPLDDDAISSSPLTSQPVETHQTPPPSPRHEQPERSLDIDRELDDAIQDSPSTPSDPGLEDLFTPPGEPVDSAATTHEREALDSEAPPSPDRAESADLPETPSEPDLGDPAPRPSDPGLGQDPADTAAARQESGDDPISSPMFDADQIDPDNPFEGFGTPAPSSREHYPDESEPSRSGAPIALWIAAGLVLLFLIGVLGWGWSTGRLLPATNGSVKSSQGPATREILPPPEELLGQLAPEDPTPAEAPTDDQEPQDEGEGEGESEGEDSEESDTQQDAEGEEPVDDPLDPLDPTPPDDVAPVAPPPEAEPEPQPEPTRPAPRPTGPTVSTLNQQGWNAVDSGDLTTALQRFDQAAGRAPGNAQAQFGLGYVLVQLGRASEANAPLCKALASNPGSLRPEIEAILSSAGGSCIE